MSEWQPRTKLGKMVQNKEITGIDEVLASGKPILEPEIVDILIPNLIDETLLVGSTQRMTDSGRKYKYRVIILVGDKNGHFGIGTGKSDEVRPAIEAALRDAKKHIVGVSLGCGSWECSCGQDHTVPVAVTGEYGGIELMLKPAPKGIGLCSNRVVRKVLAIAGVKDIWSFSRGRTSNVYNMAMAVEAAMRRMRHMKGGAASAQEKPSAQAQAAAAGEA